MVEAIVAAPVDAGCGRSGQAVSVGANDAGGRLLVATNRIRIGRDEPRIAEAVFGVTSEWRRWLTGANWRSLHQRLLLAHSGHLVPDVRGLG